MTVSNVQHVKKTASLISDELTSKLAETIDFSKILPGDKINLLLDKHEYLGLLLFYHRRLNSHLEIVVKNAICKFWSARMAERLVTNEPEELQKEIDEHIAGGAERSRDTLLKQAIVKLNMNFEKTYKWVFDDFKKIINEVTITEDVIPLTPLSKIGAAHVDRLISFECSISGMEIQQAVPDGYETEKYGRVTAETYRKDTHGPVRDYYYSDFQYYWLEESTREYSKKKILRKILGQAFDKFVGKFETGDKVRVTGFYRTIEKDKKSKSPALDVEIEIINIEKLEVDSIILKLVHPIISRPKSRYVWKRITGSCKS